MSKRALISVGCNTYDHLSQLEGAESDARRIFEALIQPSIGEYDKDFSRLLLSPRMSELQDAITEVLFSGGKVDTFVLFFAGHGGTKAGSFYMCARDARPDALSATAFSLSDVFLRIGESKPRQSNIIIDACESGGLIADLGVILKSELIGKAGTPGITLLATSARDQTSNETQYGGLGTNALLNCITGKTFVQDLTPTLDLMEMSRVISNEIGKNSDQTPVAWGLNLYGPPLFCKNPYYHSKNSASLRNVTASWPATADANLEENLPSLWDAYLSVDRDWDAALFREKLKPVLEKLSLENEAAATFIDRFSNALAERANQSQDHFRSAEVLGACATSLLQFGTASNLTDSILRNIAVHAFSQAENALEIAVSALQQNKYALLAGRGGLSDFFYLPIKITKLIGWAGAIIHFKTMNGTSIEATRILYNNLLDLLIEHYSTSIVCMSDSQSAPLALALTGANVAGISDSGEIIASLMFNSLVDCKARIADGGIEPKKVLTYLLCREKRDFSSDYSLIAQPCELLTVLLKSASLFGLDAAFDDIMDELDYVHFSAFIPYGFDDYGAERIESGNNLTYWVGHDIWRVADLEQSWPASANVTPLTVGAYGAAMLSSLLFPDRVAWFVFPKP